MVMVLLNQIVYKKQDRKKIKKRLEDMILERKFSLVTRSNQVSMRLYRNKADKLATIIDLFPYHKIRKETWIELGQMTITIYSDSYSKKFNKEVKAIKKEYGYHRL